MRRQSAMTNVQYYEATIVIKQLTSSVRRLYEFKYILAGDVT
jgi:hypothetical protein